MQQKHIKIKARSVNPGDFTFTPKARHLKLNLSNPSPACILFTILYLYFSQLVIAVIG